MDTAIDWYYVLNDAHSLVTTDEPIEQYSCEVAANTAVSFVCPNCSGDITEHEHKAHGICDECYGAGSVWTQRIKHNA